MKRFALGMGAAVVMALLNGCSGGVGGGDGGSGGAGDGPQCGGEACTEEEFCAHSEYGSHCQERPTSCEPSDHPVCGWDSAIYSNECEAAKEGVSLTSASSCGEIPDGTYICGPAFCKIGKEWCREYFEGSHSCQPLPEACDVPGTSCECLGFDAYGNSTDSAPPDCNQCYGDSYSFNVVCGSY